MIFFFFKVLITVSFYTILGKLIVHKILKNEKNNLIDTSLIGIISASIIPSTAIPKKIAADILDIIVLYRVKKLT